MNKSLIKAYNKRRIIKMFSIYLIINKENIATQICPLNR